MFIPRLQAETDIISIQTCIERLYQFSTVYLYLFGISMLKVSMDIISSVLLLKFRLEKLGQFMVYLLFCNRSSLASSAIVLRSKNF